MDFNSQQPIYLQIVHYVCGQVLSRKWQEGERVPSVRELGGALEVNPNTVLRAYDFLQQLEILNNKRGVGYFLSDDALVKVIDFKKNLFFKEELPPLFQNMALLRIGMEEVEKSYNLFKSKIIKDTNHEKEQ